MTQADRIQMVCRTKNWYVSACDQKRNEEKVVMVEKPSDCSRSFSPVNLVFENNKIVKLDSVKR